MTDARPPAAAGTVSLPPVETFTAAEAEALRPFVTNVDGPVFALVNMPEVVKGALFARYSRSAKSLRRLLLDEFLDDLPRRAGPAVESHARAEKLYDRVFSQYGDDSVAQLGGVHLACEGVSNVLTKVLERGRLMSYLEQSTRYVPYDDRVDGQWKYHTPVELEGALRDRYRRVLDGAFETYARWLEPMQAHFESRFPRAEGTSVAAYRRTVRAKALDTLRGLLPAATRSNLGIYGSGQAYEALLLRLRASALPEAREFGERILEEVRRVIPSFVARLDRPDRGGVWSEYLARTEAATAAAAAAHLGDVAPLPVPEVSLTDYDPDGEVRVVAAALYAHAALPDAQLHDLARAMSVEERTAVLQACVGERANRRHRPGRAFERTRYRFDVLTDYGAFRDLQRHRLLTIDWQTLSARHGWVVAEAVEEAGALDDWRRVMDESGELWDRLVAAGLPSAASYAVSMAYRVRFYLDMNAREAMHVLELRTAPQGHPAYRRVCQRMFELISEKAGHRAIAAAMRHVNLDPVDLERLEAEEAAEARARTLAQPS